MQPGKTFAVKIKNLLLLITLLNTLFLGIHVYSSHMAVENFEHSMAQLGENTLRSIEGGRRAFLISPMNTSPRFKRFADEILKQNNIKGVLVFDNNGEIIFNPTNIVLPKLEFIKDGEIHHIKYDSSFAVYKYYKNAVVGFHQMNNGIRHMLPPKNTMIETESEPLFAAIVLDGSPLIKVKRERATVMFAIIILQILVAAAYFFTLKFSDMFIKQSAMLDKAQNEAEMGRMGQTLAHEIKNPLSSVIGLISYAEKKVDDPKISDILQRSETELNRLNGIVNDFLTYGREIVLNITETDLNLIAEHVISLLETDINNKKLTVSVDKNLPVINADTEKFIQVMFNIILNAVQASPEGGKIFITTEDKSVMITNENNDNSHENEDVFKPFYTTKTRGTGLGLAFVKRICELHGFTVSLVNRNPFIIKIKF